MVCCPLSADAYIREALLGKLGTELSVFSQKTDATRTVTGHREKIRRFREPGDRYGLTISRDRRHRSSGFEEVL